MPHSPSSLTFASIKLLSQEQYWGEDQEWGCQVIQAIGGLGSVGEQCDRFYE